MKLQDMNDDTLFEHPHYIPAWERVKKISEIKKIELGSLFVTITESDAVKAELVHKGIEFTDKGMVQFEDGIASHLVFANITALRAGRAAADKFGV